ncbi:MAG: hypothetical protein EBZ49_07635, partial [Proteobacteria bacterium]|nr:hypothetical protein [Pseudomonadota bacterium]
KVFDRKRIMKDCYTLGNTLDPKKRNFFRKSSKIKDIELGNFAFFSQKPVLDWLFRTLAVDHLPLLTGWAGQVANT